MTENEKFIHKSILASIHMGFYPLNEIKEIILDEIEDNEFEDEIAEQWALEQIDQVYSAHRQASETWSHPTDTERLIQVFDELTAQGIIALHNPGYTTGDGEYEVIQVEQALRQEGIYSNGYCFYHEQDLERAIEAEHPTLHLHFQKVDNSMDAVTIALGHLIVSCLEKNGFTTQWNGTATQRIELPFFRWQWTFDENHRDLQDYRVVIDQIKQAYSAS